MKSSKRLRIIGITGLFGSGKTTASNFFREKGYISISLSSFLEKEATAKNIPITRKNLQDLGNQMREKYGPGILMKKALEEYGAENIVIDGIRNISELDELRKKDNSILLAIVTDRKERFKRLKGSSKREKLTEKFFRRLDLRDLGVNEKITGLQTAYCIAMADVFIEGNGSKEEFEKRLTNFMTKYE